MRIGGFLQCIFFLLLFGLFSSCLFAQKQVTINYKPRWPSHRSSSTPSAVGAVTRVSSHHSTARDRTPSFSIYALRTHTATTTFLFFVLIACKKEKKKGVFFSRVIHRKENWIVWLCFILNVVVITITSTIAPTTVMKINSVFKWTAKCSSF